VKAKGLVLGSVAPDERVHDRGGLAVPRYLKLGAGFAGLIAVAAGFNVAHHRQMALPAPVAPPPVPVAVAEVHRGDVPIVLEGLGTVQALYTATLRSQVTGTLEEVDYSEGQKVKRGQVLAKIDPRPFQAQLDQAIATLGRDQAHLDNAKANLDRFKPLFKKGFATGEQVDTQTAMVAQLQNTVKADEASIEAARTQLSYTTITAPFDGVTGIRLVDPGNIVHLTDTTGLVVLTQVQPITVIFTLPSSDIPQVQNALAQGEVKVDAYAGDDKTELDEGRLLLIDNQADPVSGTVRLRATFPNAAGRLWPGTFVNAHITTRVHQDGLTIPLTALLQGPDGPYVDVVDENNVVAARPVTAGQSRNDQVLVLSGLAPGETVVTAGQYRLANGTKVAVARGADMALVQNSSTASEGMLP
jgi:membrane fusion protein, multidrug efflux system